MGERQETRNDPAPSLRTSLRAASQWWILLAAILLLIAALRAAAVVFLPIVLGLVMAMLLAPVTARLARVMWRWLATLITMVLPVLVVAVLGGFMWFAGQQVMNRAESFSPERAVERLEEARSWLVDRGVPEQLMPGGAVNDEDDQEAQPPAGDSEPGEAEAPAPSQAELPGGMLDRAVGVITGGLGTLFNAAVAISFAFAFCALALWEAPRWEAWVASWRNAPRSAYALSLTSQWSAQLRRYLLAKAITGVASGVATGLWLWVMGVPLAFVWGGLTFLLNFVPNIGALLSAIPPTVLALVELGFGEAMLVAAGLVVIEIVAGNLLEPLLQADFLELSPFVVLASLLFWALVWGVVGAVLAPVLTAAALTAVKQLRVRSEGRAPADDG